MIMTRYSKSVLVSTMVAIGAVGVAGVVNADDILAVAWSGNTYTIDSTTGSGSLLAGSGFSSLNSMAADGSGIFYSASGPSLITIDQTTGLGTFVGDTGLLSVRGMAMEQGGPIYAINDEGFGNPDVLYTIDPNTGASSFVGTTNHASIQGLAFGTNGRLFAWDGGAGLLTVNISNGATTDVNGGIGGSFDIQCLASGPNGRMFAARDALFEIDLSDGSFTTIGSGGYSDVRGIEFTGPPADCLTLEVQNLVAGQKATFKVTGAADGEHVAVVYGLQPGSTIVNGTFGFCATFGIKGVSSSKLVVHGNISGGSFIGQKSIPAGTVGLTVHFQAAQRNTCPDECMSNLVTQVVR